MGLQTRLRRPHPKGKESDDGAVNRDRACEGRGPVKIEL